MRNAYKPIMFVEVVLAYILAQIFTFAAGIGYAAKDPAAMWFWGSTAVGAAFCFLFTLYLYSKAKWR